MNQDQAMSSSTLPRRWVLPNELQVHDFWFDDLGFLRPGHVRAAKPLEWLLEQRCVVVVGEPWSGKTFISKRLEAEARRRGRAYRVSLEEGRRANYTPLRWGAEGDRTRGPAWCLVDALDEGVYGGHCIAEVCETLYHAVTQEEPAGRFLFFTRDDATLRDISVTLSSIIGEVTVARLLPLDRDEVESVLANEKGTTTTEKWITLSRHLADPSLRPFARYYRAVEFLANQTESFTPHDVWRRMLETLCSDSRGSFDKHFRSSAQQRVEAAERLAAVTVLSQSNSVDLDDGVGLLTPRVIFPRNNQLQIAMRELRYTPLLERSSQGFRFQSRFLLEMLAALGAAALDSEALHPLATGPDGICRDDLAGFANCLMSIAPDTAAALSSKRHNVLSLDEVREWLDRIRDRAGATDTWFHGQSVLRWLGVPGLEVELAVRVSTDNQPTGARLALFDVAQANELRGSFVKEAVRIALNRWDPSSVRERAVYYVAKFGADEDVRALMSLISPQARPTRRIIARALEAFLERNLSTSLIIASVAPNALKARYVDARASLMCTIEARITLTECRQLLREWIEEREPSVPNIPTGTLDDLRQLAVRKLLEASADADEDLAIVSHLVHHQFDILENAARSALEKSVRERDDLRRTLFAKLEVETGLYFIGHHLSVHDIPWLVEDGASAQNYKYVRKVYELTLSCKPNTRERDLADAFLERNTDAVSRIVRGNELVEIERQEALARYPTRATPPKRRSLATALSELRAGAPTPDGELHWLGALCFAPEDLRRENIIGTFEDLPPAERARVVDRVCALLGEVQPTPIPTSGSSFSTLILYEGGAYVAAVRRRPEMRSDGVLASKWLPTLLFDLNGDALDALVALYHSVRTEVVAALSQALRREVAKYGTQDNIQVPSAVESAYPAHLQVAGRLPPEMWDADVIHSASASVRDGNLPIASRAQLLRHLVHAAKEAPEVRHLVGDLLDDEDLAVSALECLVSIDPVGALPRLQTLVKGPEDVGNLRILRPLFGRYHVPHVDLARINSVDVLEGYAEVLFKAIPIRPSKTSNLVTVIDEAQDLQHRITNTLIATDLGRNALRRLAKYNPRILIWLDRATASNGIGLVLAELEQRWIPKTHKVIKAFENQTYRLIRSTHDLHRTVLEILRKRVATTIAEDLDTLYARVEDKEIKAAEAVENEKRRKSPKPAKPESALQAYVRRRVSDLLPLYAETGVVELPREQQVKQRRRYDIHVIAGAPSGGVVSVVMEVKWSHDSRVRDSLVEQLGDQYLREEGKTHGLYVVGLTGAEQTCNDLLAFLEEQREAYTAKHPGLVIDIVALPCQWTNEG